MEICKIEEILERQFNNDKFKHRIFINGEWGIGKTYYVNQFKEKYKDKAIIYTSFFGKTKVEDIKKEIKHQIITKKINNEKIEKTEEFFKENQLGKILKKIGQVGTSVIENKVGINLSLENIIDLIDIDEFDENMIIIFDDLERMSSNLKMVEILGLIEKFALTRNVIVVGYEKEIEEQNKQKFKDFKEKIITREFKFEKPSKESYFEIAKKYELANSEEILEIWNKFYCNNLRVFIKCLEFVNEVKLYIKEIIDKKLTKGLTKIIMAVVIEENTENAKNKYKKLLKEEKVEGFSGNKHMLEKYERYVASHYFLNDARDYKLIEKMKNFYYGKSILKDDLKEYFGEDSEESFERFFEIAFSKSEEDINFQIDKLKVNLKDKIVIADSIPGLLKVFDSYIKWCEKLKRETKFKEDMELLRNQFVKIYELPNNGVSCLHKRFYDIHEKSKKFDEIFDSLKVREKERMEEIFLEKSEKYIENKEYEKLEKLIFKYKDEEIILNLFDKLYKGLLLENINLDYWSCIHTYLSLLRANQKDIIKEKMEKLEKENSSNVMFLYRNKIFKDVRILGKE